MDAGTAVTFIVSVKPAADATTQTGTALYPTTFTMKAVRTRGASDADPTVTIPVLHEVTVAAVASGLPTLSTTRANVRTESATAMVRPCNSTATAAGVPMPTVVMESSLHEPMSSIPRSAPCSPKKRRVIRSSLDGFRLEALNILHRLGAQELLPVGPARLPPVVGIDQRVVAEPRQIQEHVLQRPHPRVLPHLVRRAARRLVPLQHLVGRAVLDEDPAAIGAPARHRRRAALAVASVGVGDPLVEPLALLVARRSRRRIALGPELPQPRPFALQRQRRKDPLLLRRHQVDQRHVQRVQLWLGQPPEQVLARRRQ